MKFNEETILNYLDRQLSNQEVELFEKAINEDSELMNRFEQQKLVHEAMLAQNISAPTDGFAERVMLTINELDLSSSRFFNRNRIIVLILIGLIVISTLYFLSIQFYPGIGNMITNEVTLQKFTVDLDPARQVLNSELLFKMVFYVNGFIGLLLLERAVLKPYFERRKQRYTM